MTPRQRTDPQRLAVLAKRIMAHVEDPSDADRAALARHFACEAVLMGVDASLLRAMADAAASSPEPSERATRPRGRAQSLRAAEQGPLV